MKSKTGKAQRKKKAPLGLGRKIILVICMIVFIGSAGVLLDYYINGVKEQNAMEELGNLKIGGEDLVTDKGTVVAKYSELYKINPDIIGWLKIEGTMIDYPVMHTPDDPEYYLHRGFDKQKAKAGTLFMDESSDIFTPTFNFMIYGHNMKNGTMFRDLIKYESKEFYKEHKYIQFDTIYKGGQGKYEVVAAAYSKIYPASSNAFKYYKYAGATSESDFNTFIKGIKAEAAYDTGATAEYGDQLILLSTCAYHTDEGRFYVVAKRVDAKQTKPQ